MSSTLRPEVIPRHIPSQIIGCRPLAARRGCHLRLTMPLEPLVADAKLPVPANRFTWTCLLLAHNSIEYHYYHCYNHVYHMLRWWWIPESSLVCFFRRTMMLSHVILCTWSSCDLIIVETTTCGPSPELWNKQIKDRVLVPMPKSKTTPWARSCRKLVSWLPQVSIQVQLAINGISNILWTTLNKLGLSWLRCWSPPIGLWTKA